MGMLRLKTGWMRNIFVIAVFCSYSYISQAAVIKDVEYCVGEKKEVCGKNPTYDCYANDTPAKEQALAQAQCTFQTAQGSTSLKYLLETVRTFDGNKCGYHIYRVRCLDDK